MANATLNEKIALARDALVETVPELAEVDTSWGKVAADMLGVGVVEEVGIGGKVLVRWSKGEVSTWMEEADLRPLDPNARLLTIIYCGQMGKVEATRFKVSSTAGLKHNWTVEVRPREIVRTIRPDGATWTFDYNPLLRRVNTRRTLWFRPPYDDDAEALTVAELAVL